MLPIMLDPGRSPLAVVGRGAAAVRRIARLRAAGVERVRVFSDRPSRTLSVAAGDALHTWLPEREDLRPLRAIWITDLPHAVARRLADAARAAGVLVHVADAPALSDFHDATEVRRGDVVIAVSTGGRVPGLAASVRRALADAFRPMTAATDDVAATGATVLPLRRRLP